MIDEIKTMESEGAWPEYLFNDFLSALHTLQNNGYIGGKQILTVSPTIFEIIFNSKVKNKSCYNTLVVDLDVKIITADIDKNTAFLHTCWISQVIPEIETREGTVKIINIQYNEAEA